MDVRRLVLLSLGVLSVSVLSIPVANAAEPIVPLTSQEQLQQDRDTQRERDRRLSAQQVHPIESIRDLQTYLPM